MQNLAYWHTGAAVALVAAATSVGRAAEHLLISEVVINGTEFVEIVNRTSATIDLTNYYLADSQPYWRLPSNPALPTSNDFVVRFPAGASIPSNGVIVVAIKANLHVAAYGTLPDFELPVSSDPTVPDMLPAFANSIGFGPNFNDTGEGITLFHWDQASDLVDDVDIIRAGLPPAGNDISSKTGIAIDGPDADTTPTTFAPDSMTMPVMLMSAGSGLSHKRRFEECGAELNTLGNGITSHDETSENISQTWDGSGIGFIEPNPGIVPPLPNVEGCPADIAPAGGNGVVNVDDLLAVINGWGPCANPNDCPADAAPCGGNDTVNVDDLLAVINGWGPCP